MLHMAIRLSLIALLTLVLVTPCVAEPEPQKTIFYNVTTSDTWAAGMALGQAGMALKNGYAVVVFLNVRAVYLAAKSHPQDTFSGTGQDAHAMLSGLIEKGARVVICPMCMKKAAISESDLLPGVELGGPAVTFPLMTADDTVVMSY